MNNITQEIVEEFKLRIKLDGNEEDDNLMRILLASAMDLVLKVGPYTIEENPVFKELVFERSRYVYNDALEYFDTNFVSQLTLLAINNADNSSGGGGSTPTTLTREQIVEILGYNPANEGVIPPIDTRVTNNTNSINTLNTSVMNNTNSVNQFNVRLTTLNSTLDALTSRVTDLENRPQVDLTPVNNRLDELDLHVANNDIHKTSSVIRQEQNTPLRTEVVSSLPTSNLNTGRIVFDSSDNTFRGYNGGEWV